MSISFAREALLPGPLSVRQDGAQRLPQRRKNERDDLLDLLRILLGSRRRLFHISALGPGVFPFLGGSCRAMTLSSVITVGTVG